MGGRARMVAFLRDLHARRSFDPFTTWDLADEIQASGGVDVRERFRLWLYQSPAARTAGPAPSAWDWLHEVDLTLPAGPSGRRPWAGGGSGPDPPAGLTP